mgnify:CR=1 FL=1
MAGVQGLLGLSSISPECSDLKHGYVQAATGSHRTARPLKAAMLRRYFVQKILIITFDSFKASGRLPGKVL